MWDSGVTVAIYFRAKVIGDLVIVAVGGHGGGEGLHEGVCERVEVHHHIVGAPAPEDIDIVVVDAA